MVTNKERREIAAELREIAARNRGLLSPKEMERVLLESQAVLGTVGLGSVADVLERHADLIEPVRERTCRMEPTGDGSVVCSECRTEYVPRWLVDGGYPEPYCSGCGAKVAGRP